ncbi:penicillin-binding protein [Sphingobacterium sp. DK4209]|uniref:Penicillin-binding protein n=2 Tax=Sphingobacterium zhuxiongii TaxID=2662364 RepID=A0A5Q0QDJ6_9SPHI|nr:penicillin-binding protein [Sphingobacterium sp. DK4209]QGA28287.1 penicillin-binding protein [Sphingobacterium sp. dk4302]
MVKERFKRLDFSFLKKRWFLISSGSIIAILMIGLFWGLSVRGKMLDQAVVKVKKNLKEDYQLDLRIGSYDFAGLTTVEFQKVRVVPDSADQLAAMDKFKVSIKLFPLISGTIKIGSLEMENADISLVKEDSTSNYDFLFRKKANDSTKVDSSSRTLAETVDGLIKQVFLKVPSDLSLNNVNLSYQDSSGRQIVRIPVGEINNGDYDVDVFLNEQDAKWNFSGEVDPDRQTLSVKITSDNKDAELPFLRKKFGLRVSFDELSFHLDDVSRKGKDVLEVLGGWSTKNLKVFQRRLSAEQIILPAASALGGFHVSENTVQLVEGTKVQVKDFTFEPLVKFTRKPKKLLSLAVHTGKFKAQNFFDAIPKGLFDQLDGLQVDGDIQYDMDFEVDLNDPDQLKFNSKIDDSSLKIVKWGRADIAALNQPFIYEAYNDTTKMRDIMVGPSNPQFTPLNQISSILKKTVLNTEDPFFYKHKGFELEAFQLSIVTNIKEKKFKRGASTISMQLVKNVFLNRNKTMMRKFEEILLVWLMEQSGQVSKDRLLEIYLNVIEWGKNVYGISEASNYYFGKKPSEITIGESLFLSSIIPRPKTGLSSFDYTGHLKPWVLRHFNTYGYIMNKMQQLDNENVPANYGFYQVELLPNLRPPRPKGIVDTSASFDDIKDMAEEMDMEEQLRRSIRERLFGPIEKKEEN